MSFILTPGGIDILLSSVLDRNNNVFWACFTGLTIMSTIRACVESSAYASMAIERRPTIFLESSPLLSSVRHTEDMYDRNSTQTLQ